VDLLVILDFRFWIGFESGLLKADSLLRYVPMSEGHRMVPVWFFVGVILLIYGVLILATGIYEFSHPPATVLANLHPAVWWGALLTIVGGVYVYLYLPRKS
jgi:hypothetical protein